MNQNNLLTGFGVLVLLAGAGIAQAATTNRRGQQQDKQFLRTLAIADMTEANLAEMARDKATKPPVKDFAQTVVKDQTDEYGQLSMLAGKTGESIPKGINTGKNPTVRTLMHMKGDSFDHAFLRDEIADQQRIVSALQRESSHGENADIKAWAGKELSVRQQELQQAQSLAK